MRTPVHRIKGTQRADTVEDILSDALSKHYTVEHGKTLTDAGKSFTAGILLPKYKLIVEIQQKQDNKGIIKEIADDRIARAAGWTICRFSENEARLDPDSVLYKIRREIERK